MVTIPMRSLASFTQEVTLEGVPYRMVFKWNSRGAFMTLDFETAAGEMLVAGMKLPLNTAPLRMHPGRGLPPGELLMIDSAGRNAKITLDDIEKRIDLVYLTEDEYAAFR
jgi:hypothetical protein